MISVEQASTIVSSHLFKPPVISLPVDGAVSYVLAEPIHADRDSPPFHRVTMDGIAISFGAWKTGQREFVIEEVQAAGVPQKKLRQSQHAIEVMTGAVLPEGTDTVIRYEDLKIESGKAWVQAEAIVQFQSVHQQGIDAKRNDILLVPGTALSPAEIALLASVGRTSVKVYAFPRTAIVSSGDELVDISQTPEPHQIRRSNSYAIQAAMKALGWNGTQFHLPDKKDILQESLATIIRDHDVVILSGGVSQGKYDFIPAVMEELGVRKLFHQVSQRPGKPFWFGVSDNGKTVFALPGNPVSTFMCFYRYIKPWLLKSLGISFQPTEGILAKDFSFQPQLTYFLQVNAVNEKGKIMAYPDAGGGSGDFINLKKVTGFLELPKERTEFKAGEAFRYFPFRL